MCPELFKVGPFVVHGYGFCIAIGVLAAYWLSTEWIKKAGLDEDMVTWFLLTIAVGGVLGSKILNYITLIRNGTFELHDLYDLKNGYVVYGGLIGGVLACVLMCAIKKVELLAYADLIIPTVALAQGFGRIGCFMAGCCYGKETDGMFGVVFPANSQAPPGVKLFPVQLVFALCDFLMFAILVRMMKRKPFRGKIFSCYIILYSVGRFVLEDFRGDGERGHVGLFSTSQLVSFAMVVTGAVLFFVMKRVCEGRTLYVSDLDGTLLRSDEHTSAYTNDTVNALIENGMLFSYATARSVHTARKVTAGLCPKLPLVVYNGAMIADGNDGTLLRKNFFETEEAHSLLETLFSHEVYPIVYAFIDGEEKFSYVEEYCSAAQTEFIKSRGNDVRKNPADDLGKLYRGEIFYITCIGDEEKLAPLYEQYRETFHCVYAKDIYSGEQWLEIMPKAATKANAAKQLKELLNCKRLVVFGDAENDTELFEAADEAYAVENATEGLKALADGVIESNDEDGVAKWLAANWRKSRKKERKQDETKDRKRTI